MPVGKYGMTRLESAEALRVDLYLGINNISEEAGYTGVETAGGNEAGLAFYRRHRADFERMGAGVLVYSVLGTDSEMKGKFVELGLPEENFVYKVSYANVNFLLERMERALSLVGKRRR